MLRLISRRLIISIPLLFLVSALSFVLVSLTPGDAARTILGFNGNQAQYLALRRQMGLDKPVYVQYWNWLSHAVRGDLGTSLLNNQSVTQALNQRLQPTLSLILLATLLAAVLGIGLGVLSAVRSGLLGRVIDVLSLAGLALPSFWLGLLLVAFLAVRVHLFPATGYTPISQSPGAWLQGLILPVVTLAFGAMAVVAKQTRDTMRTALDRDFIRTLRANGVGEGSIVFKHALRTAAIPVVTVLGLVFIGLLSGTVLVESVFVLPGLGGLAVQATTSHDLPLVQGAVLYFTILVVIVNLVVDLSYGWLNPKARAT